MEHTPNKIYLNIGTDEEIEDFNELSEVSWSDSRINDSDIEYLNGKTAFPVFDLLQKHLENGAEIVEQDGWNIFDKDGETVAKGETIRDVLINLIFGEC